MSSFRPARLLLWPLLAVLLAADCERGPEDEVVREVVEQQIDAAFQEPVMELTSFKRLGSGPLAAGADGRPRRIVYYNAVLTLRDDLNVSSWSGLNVASLANLLGATEQGITGLRVDRNIAQLLNSKRDLWDVRDSTTPKAMVELLAKIDSGKLLRPENRAARS